MGNATANERFFTEERAQLVQAIIEAVGAMRGASLRKLDVITTIDQAVTKFEKETYDNEESER